MADFAVGWFIDIAEARADRIDDHEPTIGHRAEQLIEPGQVAAELERAAGDWLRVVGAVQGRKAAPAGETGR